METVLFPKLKKKAKLPIDVYSDVKVCFGQPMIHINLAFLHFESFSFRNAI